MQKTAITGVGVLTLTLVGIVTFGTPSRTDAKPRVTSIAPDRVAVLERKMANLERIVGIDLGDDAAVQRVIREEKRAQQTRREMAIVSMVQTIRSQMELYQVQHKGNYPNLSVGWGQLTNPTDINGGVAKPERGKAHYGPYLGCAPVNPLTGSSRVGAPGSAGPNVGWTYDPKTAEIRIVASKAQATRLNLDPDDAATY